MVVERLCWLFKPIILALVESVASLFTRNAEVNIAGYYLAVLIVLILVAKKGIREVIDWNLEIYAIIDVDGKGYVHKWWHLNKGISDAITDKEPFPAYSQPWYFWLWAWITGEDMYRVSLLSSKHGMYLDGRKISFRFIRALDQMRNTKPSNLDEPNMNTLREINYAYSQNLIEKGTAKDLVGKAIAKNMVKT